MEDRTEPHCARCRTRPDDETRGRRLSRYMRRWLVGVSSEGHAVMSMKVRPEPKDSGFEAREAPWRESKTAEPSDNRRGRSPTTRLRSRKGHSRSQPPLAIGRELRATCLTMPRKHSLIVVAHRVTEARRIVANQSSPSNGGAQLLFAYEFVIKSILVRVCGEGIWL
jgi:hypothetical protein